MKNASTLLILVFLFSCQVLDKREVLLNPNFCAKCKKPLRELMLRDKGVYVVKFNAEKLFYNYDQSKVNIDSLENELMKRGYLARKDSIVIYPVCCSKESKSENQKLITPQEGSEENTSGSIQN